MHGMSNFSTFMQVSLMSDCGVGNKVWRLSEGLRDRFFSFILNKLHQRLCPQLPRSLDFPAIELHLYVCALICFVSVIFL